MRRILFVSLLGMACGAESLDVGDTDAGVIGTGGSSATGGTGGSAPQGPPLPVWPAPTDCVASSNLDIVGTWEGAIRSFSFETLVPLRLEIRGASELGGVCGTLRWGEGPPPEPIADPSQGWPDDERLGGGGAAAFLREGTAYTVLSGGVSENEVHFSINSAELWREWCSLQTSYFHQGTEAYYCDPDYSYAKDDASGDVCELVQTGGSSVFVDCAQWGICESEICVCNEAGCGANTEYVHPSPTFAITVEGDRATGRVVGAGLIDEGSTDIVLNRVP